MDQKNKARSGGGSCNLDYLLVNLGRNEVAARRLVHLFLDNYPNLLRRLDDALGQRDLLALQRVVHDIRGNCVLFSAQDCLDHTHRIEGLLRDFPEKGEEGILSIDWEKELFGLRESLVMMVAELKAYLGNSEPAG